jgi:hypothetical protein
MAACATTIDGPSRLRGEELEAATALYGPWDAELIRHGRPVYIWRRSVALSNGERRVCELRVTLGFRTKIGMATEEGFDEACRLFDVRYETVTR